MYSSGICSLILIQIIVYVESHGRLMDPVARSSAWRIDPSFPIYHNDNEMVCGGPGTQWIFNSGKCGICGENYASQKLFEMGGKYYTGRNVRKYKKGQTIDVHVELTANHLGSVEFRICSVDNVHTDATQDCLDQNILKSPNGVSKFPVLYGERDIYFQLNLPKDLICSHCVFQWRYNTSNTFGNAVEQFYGCADIEIFDITTTTSTSTTTMSSTISTQTTTITETKTSLITISKLLSTTTSLGSKLCYRGDGYYADSETECRKYYLCAFSKSIYEQISYIECPGNLLFDQKLLVCNDPKLVDCNTKKR